MPSSPLTRAGALAAFAHPRLLFTAFVLAVVVMAVERCCHHDLPAIPVLIGVLSNKAVWKRYEQWLLGQPCRAATIRHKRTILRGFWSYLERRKPPRAWHEGTPEDLRRWLDQPCQPGGPNAGEARSRNTRASYSRHALVFYRWATDARLLARNPFQGVRAERWAARRPRALDLSVVGKLLAELEDDRRLHMIAMICYWQALRIGEVARLSVEDIDLHKARPVMRIEGKGGVEEWMEISPGLLGGLRAWLLTRPPTGPLIPNYQCPGRHLDPKYIAHLFAKATRPVVGDSAHALRHTHATELYEATGDIRKVQLALRHASVTSTEGYVKTRPGQLLAWLAQLPDPTAGAKELEPG